MLFGIGLMPQVREERRQMFHIFNPIVVDESEPLAMLDASVERGNGIKLHTPSYLIEVVVRISASKELKVRTLYPINNTKKDRLNKFL